jgi:hypothetical protein
VLRLSSSRRRGSKHRCRSIRQAGRFPWRPAWVGIGDPKWLRRRRIGLSLGADICWPICYEEIIKRLDLAVEWQGDRVGVAVDRVTIEPFDLRQPCRYDVVLDRLTHWYSTSREWIKKPSDG